MADNFLVADAQRAAVAESDFGYFRDGEIVELSAERCKEWLCVEKTFDRDQAAAQGGRGLNREDLRDADSQYVTRDVELLTGQRYQLTDTVGVATQNQPTTVSERH